MCMIMKEMEWPSLAAVKEEFSRLGEVLDMLKHMDKCAVVSDSGFVRTVAKIEGALFRGLTVKAFEMDEKDEALGWLGA